MTAVAPIAEGLARFEARGPCTDAERRAAAWLHDELRDARARGVGGDALGAAPVGALDRAARDGRRGGVAGGDQRAAAGADRGGGGGGVDGSGGLGLPGLLRLAFPRRATQNVLTVPEEGEASRC